MPTISINIKAPNKFHVLQNQHVVLGDLLGETEIQRTALFNLALELGVSPRKVITNLVKKIGDEISKGEIIAFKKTLFGQKTVKAPISGVLKSLSDDTGKIEISWQEGKIQKFSPVTGVVLKLDKESVEIEYQAELISGILGKGTKYSKLKILSGENEDVDMFSIKQFDKTKILVGYRWNKESFKKAQAMEMTVVGVEIEGVTDMKQNWVLESGESSFIIISKDLYSHIVPHDGAVAILLGSENSLYIQHS